MRASTPGRSLTLYFINGRPDGMLTAEVFNWTGHVLMFPRTQISEALRRDETSYTGVYLLVGERDGASLGYIGESENIRNRIRKHESTKDWWDVAVILTSAANQLNKAHVRYLEARLIEEARAAGRLVLDNTTEPEPARLSEADTANMEAFLNHVLLVLPALRIDYFLRQIRPTISSKAVEAGDKTAPVFELRVPKYDIHATSSLVDGEFVVQQGSRARKQWVGREKGSYGDLFADLVRSGILVEEGEHRVFAESYAFRSPSAAAAVVSGRSANGRKAWKVQGQAKTYKQWEEEELAAGTGEGP